MKSQSTSARSVITAKPAGWFTWDYQLSRHGELLTTVDLDWTRDAGEFVLGGHAFQVRRTGFAGWFGALQLSTVDRALCTARQPNILSRRFVIEFEEGSGEPTLVLVAASAFGRRFNVLRGDQRVGSIGPAGWVSRKATIEVEDPVALPLQVFLFGIVAISWRQAAQNNS